MSSKVTRRGFLAFGASAALAGVALAACSGGGSTSPSSTTSSTSAATSAPAPTSAAAATAAPSSATSSGSATAAPAQQATSGQAVTIREAQFPGVGWEQDPRYTDVFMKAHPNVKVVTESTPYAQMYQQVLTQGATGTLPDIYPGHTRWVSYWEYKGL